MEGGCCIMNNDIKHRDIEVIKHEEKKKYDIDKPVKFPESSKFMKSENGNKFDIDKPVRFPESSKFMKSENGNKFDIDKPVRFPESSKFKKSENGNKFDIDKPVKFLSQLDSSELGKESSNHLDSGENQKGSEIENKDKSIENVDKEEKAYTDDNGKIYRIGNELLPNNTYEINGYKYETDDKGRIISAEGTLQAKDHDGKKEITDKMKDVGKGDQKENDQRGHLIGDQFNGGSGLENLVPQDAKLNNGEVKELENSLAKEVKNGNEVYLKVEPHYSGDSQRPDSFKYTYIINGEKSIKVFRNGE